LTADEADEVDVAWVYADLHTAPEGLMSAGPPVKAIQTSGEDRAIVGAMAAFKVGSGGYGLENQFRYLIAGVLAEGYALHLPQEDQ
jgi:hypothetical protein